MTTYGGVTVLSVSNASGQGSVEVMASELEGGAFGIGLTEKEGLNVRRVAVELDRLEDVRALHDAMGAFLAKHSAPQHNTQPPLEIYGDPPEVVIQGCSSFPIIREQSSPEKTAQFEKAMQGAIKCVETGSEPRE